MIFLKKLRAITLTLCLMLLNASCSYDAYQQLREIAQDFFLKAGISLRENQSSLVIAGVSTPAVTYYLYALYLDTLINNKNNLWYWSMQHIQNGTIEQNALIELTQERHPELKSLHPFTAILATTHTIHEEIDRCITLRGMVKNLNTVGLGWLLGQTTAALDKKLESLYILKIMLSNYTLEVRKKCRQALER